MPELSSSEILERISRILSGMAGTSDGQYKSGSRAERRFHRPVLVLDNFDHLLPDGASYVEELLQRCPDLCCLLTSRTRLFLPGEQVLPVTPLAVPSEAALVRVAEGRETPLTFVNQWPSVALLNDRIRSVRPEFRLTHGNVVVLGRLAKILDGLPLAMELAAARSQVYTPSQMLQMLPEGTFTLLRRKARQAEDRHCSLYDTLAWSTGLLTSEARALLARLSVFRGGWTVEAAEAIDESETTLDELALLCDASLVRTTVLSDPKNGPVVRFSLLAAVREFAAEMLNKNEDREAESRAVARHGDYFTEFASTAGKGLQDVDESDWLTRTHRERDNLLLAIERGNAGCHLLLIPPLQRYWIMRGPLSPVRAALETAITQRREISLDRSILLRALNTAGVLATTQNDYRAARRRFRQALWCVRQNAKESGTPFLPGSSMTVAASSSAASEANAAPIAVQRHFAVLLNNMGTAASSDARYAEARRWFEASLAHWRTLGDARLIAAAMANSGAAMLDGGDLQNAQERLEGAIIAARDASHPRVEGMALRNLGELHHRQDDYSQALSFYRQSLRVLHGLSDRLGVALSLFDYGLALAASGSVEQGASLMAVAAAVCSQQGHPLPIFAREEYRYRFGSEVSAETASDASLEDAVAQLLSDNVFAASPARFSLR